MARWPETLYVAREDEHTYVMAESLADLKNSKGGKQEVGVYNLSKITRTRVKSWISEVPPEGKKTEEKTPITLGIPLANVFGTTVPAPPKEEPRPIPKKRR